MLHHSCFPLSEVYVIIHSILEIGHASIHQVSGFILIIATNLEIKNELSVMITIPMRVEFTPETLCMSNIPQTMDNL
jgi:hypothetical protein